MRHTLLANIPVQAIITLLALLVCSGCDTFTERLRGDSVVQLHTGRAQYTAHYERGEGNYRQYGFDVVATFDNQSDRTVYLNRCYPDSRNPTYGVRRADGKGEWENRPAYNPVWACVGTKNPIAISAGETRVDTLHLEGPNGWDGVTGEPHGVMEGRFHLHYEASSCPEPVGCELADSLALSNAFEVRIEE